MKVMEKVESQTDQDGASWPAVPFPSTVNAIKENIIHHLMSFQGRDPEMAGARDVYKALAYTMRDLMVQKWISTQKTFYANQRFYPHLPCYVMLRLDLRGTVSVDALDWQPASWTPLPP